MLSLKDLNNNNEFKDGASIVKNNNYFSNTHKHMRSTSMNSGPFSSHQNFNKKSKENLGELAPATPNAGGGNGTQGINLYPNSLGNMAKLIKFNPHNNENMDNFRKKSISYRFKNDRESTKTFLKGLKDVDKQTSKEIFSNSQTKKTFYLNRKNNNYDGFEGYSIPKVHKRNNSASKEKKDLSNKDVILFNKNYQKLLNSIVSKTNLKQIDPEEEEKVVEKLCEEENSNLKKVIKDQKKVPIRKNKENPKTSHIYVGPRIFFGKGNLINKLEKSKPMFNQIAETTHVPHVEGNTFITNVHKNNYT